MNKKLLKLAKMLIKFDSMQVGDKMWVYEGELMVGTEVYIEGDEGEMIAVADGEYETEIGNIVVAEGKVVEIKEIEQEMPEEQPAEEPVIEEMAEEMPEEQPAEEPVVDEKDERIAELEAKIEELEAVIEDKDAKIAALEEQLVKPVEEPVEMKATPRESKKENAALKYFAE